MLVMEQGQKLPKDIVEFPPWRYSKAVLGNLLEMTPPEEWSWTRWSPKIPFNFSSVCELLQLKLLNKND